MDTNLENKYEFSFLLKIGEAEDELQKIVTNFGANIKSKTSIKEIELAYPIKKSSTAQFGVYVLEIENRDIMKDISAALELKDFILRHLFVKVPKERAKKIKKDRKEKPEFEAKESVKIDNLTNEKLEETLEEILK